MADDHIEFDWDLGNIEHIGRHGVRPKEVEETFDNEPVDIEYAEIGGEPRWTSIGHTVDLRVLLIVWTLRRGKIRPITARTVSKKRHIEYLQWKGFPV